MARYQFWVLFVLLTASSIGSFANVPELGFLPLFGAAWMLLEIYPGKFNR